VTQLYVFKIGEWLYLINGNMIFDN
jgi:hypothetical protein